MPLIRDLAGRILGLKEFHHTVNSRIVRDSYLVFRSHFDNCAVEGIDFRLLVSEDVLEGRRFVLGCVRNKLAIENR